MTDDDQTTLRPLDELDAGALLDAVQSSIVVHDEKGRILWSNPAADRLLASFDATIVGLPADHESYTFFRDDETELPRDEYPVSVVLETGRPVEDMVLGVTPPGVSETSWLLVNAVPLLVGKDHRTVVVVTSTDFTERKRNKDWESNRNEQLLENAEILSNQGAWEWDITNDQWTFSENWLRIHGCRETGISQEELMAVAHPDDRARIENAFQAALAGGDAYSIEHRIVRQDDQSIRVVKALGEVWFDKEGQPRRMLGSAQDITEQKRAAEAVREADRRFRVAQDISPDGFTILRPVREESGQIVDFAWVYENDAIARLNGTDPEAVVGRRLLDLFPGHSGTPFFAAYQRVAESGEPTTFEDRYQGESIPEPIWFRIVVVPMGGDIAVLSQDITERKRAEEELEESRDRLRKLTVRLDEVREEERTVLARELHDDVGQNLTALRMDLSGMEREIPDEMKHLTDRLHSMIALTQDSVDRLNRLSSDLRSPILDMLGLEDAVESEVWDYQERWNTEVDLEMDLGGVETSPDADLTAYRILKESLANVRRHAQASRVEVKLKVMGDSLELIVLDDGLGITDGRIKAPDSFGLIGMSERADWVGGKVEVQRGEEGGTLVRAVIPIRPEAGGSP